ncbi:MAG: hypothetical protein FVQ83_13295 [Chloroflexi bacterium]|nr:hypothetical protein [Chloroflexota bacterium]
MSTSDQEYTRSLLVRGIAAAKANELNSARSFLERVLNAPAARHQIIDALYWLSEISQDAAEKRERLVEILSLNPGDPRAKRSLALLEGRLQPSQMIDPNKFEPTSPDEPITTDAQRFMCPNCGSRMVYTPDGSGLVCEHCQYSENMTTDETIDEQDFIIGMATARGHTHAVATRSFSCEACGAVYILDSERISLTCPHCDSVYTFDQAEELELIPPEGIIPFAINQSEAQAALRVWLKSIGVKKPISILVSQGVYLPKWSLDFSGLIPFAYERYQNEKWSTENGTESAHFNNILAPASEPQPAGYDQIIESFDLEQLKPFQPDYLANWLAETYRVKMSDAALDGRLVVLEKAKKNIMLKRTGGMKDLRLDSSGLYIQSFKLILLPIWIMRYRVKKQEFGALVNGQTAEAAGEHPARGLRKFANWLLGNN